MSLVIFRSVSRSLKCAVEEALGEIGPGRIVRLLGDERAKVELLVVLVGLCARIGEEALVVELFGDLASRSVESNSGMRTCLTSRIRFGVIRNSREPDFCSSTVVSGRGFLARRQPNL